MMQEDHESQVSPLAPSELYLRSDEGSSTTARYQYPHKQKSASKLIVYFLITIASLIILFILFGSIFFLARTPKAKLRSVTISNLKASTTNTSTLNMTMTAEITINNRKNFGRFELTENYKASVIYENVSMGEGDIFGGNFSARKTGTRNLTVQVRSNQYLSNNTDFKNDIKLGLVQISSFCELRGKVHVTKIIKRHKTAVLNCTMTLNLTGQAIQDLVCR